MCAATKMLEEEAARRPVNTNRRTTAQMSGDPRCTGKERHYKPPVGMGKENERILHCHMHDPAQESDFAAKLVHNNDAISGSGEELKNALEKIVSQLGIITQTLHVLEQRVSMNEESVTGVIDYFRDARESQARKQNLVMQFNPDAIVETLKKEREARLLQETQ